MMKLFVRDDVVHADGPKIREWFKGYLDFIRNLVVVSLLFVIAEKSGKWYISLLAWSGLIALEGYYYTYLQPWRPNLPAVSSRWLARLMFLIAGGLLVLLVFAASASILITLGEIKRVQAH